MSLHSLGDERYVSLATFRKNGEEVRTPVWIARDGKDLFVYTNVTSGKVKRIRNDRRVRLAPCDLRGNVRGDWEDGTAGLVEDEPGRDRGFRTLIEKYGWQMKLGLFSSKLSGRYEQRAIVQINLVPSAPS